MVVRTDKVPLGFSDCCFYCGRKVVGGLHLPYAPIPENAFTREHFQPRSKGGGVRGTACYKCNCDKNALTLDEYRVVRAFRAGLLPVPDYKFAAEQRV